MAEFYELRMLLGLLPTLTFPALMGIATYVLTALTLYTLAQRRGISSAWLAWVPVANVWILGSLSDQYRYVARGEIRSKRKSLVILNILAAVIAAVVAVMAAGLIWNLVWGIINGASDAILMKRITGPVMNILGLALPALAIGIAKAILYYMALYDVYKSMDPANCVVFTVLSLLFSVTEPFFLFFNRNKDLGMPPRRDTYENL